MVARALKVSLNYSLDQSFFMSNRPTPLPGVLTIDKYIPGRASAPSGIKTVKLSANESPLGASPKAIEAYHNVAGNLALYPEGSSHDIRDALAKAHGLEADNIVVGAGSGELLHMLAQAYLGAGDEAIINAYGFLLYPVVAKGAGATPVYASAPDYRADVDALLAAVTPRTKIVFLDNPNNPTGTYLNAAELTRLHAGLPENVLLVVDGAYAEYVTADEYATGVELVRAHENVVMVRTFSKMGLAALRIGWLYGPDHIVDALHRLRGPFNVNMAAQSAGVAALEDTEFTNRLVAHNAEWRQWLTAELSSNQLKVLPSQGNFILVVFPDEEGLRAKDADAFLLERGLVTRQMGGYGLPNALRISIGDETAMRAVAAALHDFIGGAKDV